nr:leucine-rich repeat extensin-like protein 5 isoform X4 [Oncorhynchus nerka]
MSEAEGCVSVWEWLCALHLDQYFPVFKDAGFGTLLECQGLTQDQLETIGIKLPGHRKRILVSLQKTHHHTHPEREHDALLTHLAAEGDQREEERAVFRPSPLGRETPLPAQRPVSRGERPVPKERSVFREEERDGERPRPIPKERTKYRSVPVETLDCGQTSPHPNPTFCPTTPNPNSTSYSTAPHSTAQDPPLPPIPPRSTPNGPPLRFIPTSSKHSPMAPKPRHKHNNTHSSTNTPTTVPLPSLSTNPLTVPLPSLSTNPPPVPLPSLSTNFPTVPLPILSTNPPTVPLPSLSTKPLTVPLPSLSTNPRTVPLPSFSTNPPTVPLPSLSTNPPTVPLHSLSPSPVSPARHPQQMGEGGRKPSPVSPSSSSSSSFSVEQYDQSSSSDQCVPTLPPKVYVVGAGPKEPRGPAPIPRRPPVLPPRTTPTHSDASVNEPHTERTPPPPPRTRVHNTPVDTQPALPMRRVPQPPPEISEHTEPFPSILSHTH